MIQMEWIVVIALGSFVLTAITIGCIIRLLWIRHRSGSSRRWKEINGRYVDAIDTCCSPYEELREGTYRKNMRSISEESRVPTGSSTSLDSSNAGSQGTLDESQPGKLHKKWDQRTSLEPDDRKQHIIVKDSERRWSEMWKLKSKPRKEPDVPPGKVPIIGQQHRDSCYSTMSESSILTRGFSLRSNSSQGTSGNRSSMDAGSSSLGKTPEVVGQLVFTVEFMPMVSFRGRLKIRLVEGVDLPARAYGGIPSPFVEARLVKWGKQDQENHQLGSANHGLVDRNPALRTLSTHSGSIFSGLLASKRRPASSTPLSATATPTPTTSMNTLYFSHYDGEQRGKKSVLLVSPILFQARTETVKKTRNPRFDQTIEIDMNVSDLVDTNLQLSVLDDDKFGNPTLMGTTLLSLPKDELQLYVGRNATFTRCIVPTTLSRGSMQLTLNYMPSAKRVSACVERCVQLDFCSSDQCVDGTEFCIRSFLLTASGRVIRRRKTSSVPVTPEVPTEVLFQDTLIFSVAPSQLESVTLLLVFCVRSPPLLPTTTTTTISNALPLIQSQQQPLIVTSRDEVKQKVSGTGEDFGSRMHKFPVRFHKGDLVPIGKVAVGANVNFGRGREHWQTMAANPRNATQNWHSMF
ncbi:unnamed protein product [Notodromas monacha]|uniref:C2 domain-containing protein n=1 Tax=Notodromas monacha TaxID=399045 RepID=A0A7R9BUD6_9CRUS|nr:unnamed protein product [Notodromas monacha]CAG0921938.1 unnamed protein product [Notodromas monacha]